MDVVDRVLRDRNFKTAKITGLTVPTVLVGPTNEVIE
jgi:hypothetical protein